MARLAFKTGNIEGAVQNFIGLFTKKNDVFNHFQLKKNLQEFQQLIIQYSLFDQEFFLDLPVIENNFLEVVLSDRYTLLPSIAPNIWINGKHIMIY
jgi:hypothetical protein